MEIQNPIQFIDFASNVRRRNITDSPFEGIIYSRRGTNKAYMVRLPFVCNEAVEKGYGFLRVAVNNLSNEIFVVFDKKQGMEVKKKKYSKVNDCMTISNREFVSWLETRLGLSEGGGVFFFSENLDRNNGFTFKISAKR